MRAVWTGEHHGMDFTIAPNPFINIADLARRTKQIRLGTGTIVAPFWHPIKLAGEAAMTDIICGGRLEVGIARGAYQYEYERLMPGMDAWQAGQRMREIVPVIKNFVGGRLRSSGRVLCISQNRRDASAASAGRSAGWIAPATPAATILPWAAAAMCK